jgi:hypothetical protein
VYAAMAGARITHYSRRKTPECERSEISGGGAGRRADDTRATASGTVRLKPDTTCVKFTNLRIDEFEWQLPNKIRQFVNRQFVNSIFARAFGGVPRQHQIVETQVARPDELGVAEQLRVVSVGGLVRYGLGRPEDRGRP